MKDVEVAVEIQGRSKLIWILAGTTTTILFLIIMVFAVLTLKNIANIQSELDGNQKTKSDNKPQITNEMANIAGTGSGRTISLSKGSSTSSGSYIVNQWSFDNVDAESGSYFETMDNSMIRIKQDGVYSISAQMSFRMKLGVASFEIRKWDEENPDGKSLSRCIAAFPNEFAQLKSCFTSKSVQLKRGDLLFVAAFRDDFTMDFTGSRSSFAVALVKLLDNGDIKS